MVNPKNLDWTQAVHLPKAYQMQINDKLEELSENLFKTLPSSFVDREQKIGDVNGLGFFVAWDEATPDGFVTMAFVLIDRMFDTGSGYFVYRAVIKDSDETFYTNATYGENFDLWCKSIIDSVGKSLRNYFDRRKQK